MKDVAPSQNDEETPTDSEFLEAVETALLAGIRCDWRIVGRLMSYARRGAKPTDNPELRKHDGFGQ